MARAARPIRFLLTVALGTSLLLLLTVLVGFRYFKRAPQHAREHAAPAWHDPVAVCAEAKPESAAPQRPSLRVEGPTAFVRRLAAGEHLLSLSRELDNAGADRAAVLADFRTLKRFLRARDGGPVVIATDLSSGMDRELDSLPPTAA